MIKTIVVGPRGKMGRLITQIAADSKELELIAGVGAKDRDYIGQDLGQTALLGRNLGVFVKLERQFQCSMPPILQNW